MFKAEILVLYRKGGCSIGTVLPRNIFKKIKQKIRHKLLVFVRRMWHLTVFGSPTWSCMQAHRVAEGERSQDEPGEDPLKDSASVLHPGRGAGRLRGSVHS